MSQSSKVSRSFGSISVKSPAVQSSFLTADTTLGTSHAGDNIFLSSTTGTTLTLPSPSSSLAFHITVAALPLSGEHSVVGSSNLHGALAAASAPIVAAGSSSLTTGAGAALGDSIHLISDGNNWFVSGTATTDTSFVAA